jgi:3-oxoacyl-[acyl-carrier-protein] synthase II
MNNGTNKRVVVTGIGIVSCVGLGKEAFWNGILNEAPTTERRVTSDFDASQYFGPKEVRRADRFTQFAVAAAEMCLDDAGRPDVDLDRAGVFIATGIGGLSTLEEQIGVRIEKGEKRVSPFLVPMMMGNAAAGNVSMRVGWRGPSETTVTACSSATHAIGNAARVIASGRCNVMLTGGSEAAMTATGIAGFRNMTALSNSGISRPFDVERDGFVIAEGAGVILLEELEHAKARGAHIYAEIVGAANTADAHHITAPEPHGAGAVNSMLFAIEDAGMKPSDIKHINAHGTSTPLNDAAEAMAVNKVFGSPGPVTTSIKGVTGHSLGAAGALEAAASVLSIERKLIPPTRNTKNVDPEIELDLVLDEPKTWEPGPVLSNSFGFGGHNGSLVFTPVD